MAKLNIDLYRLYTQAFGSGVGLPFPGPFDKGSVNEGGDFERFELNPGVKNDPPLKGDFNFKSPQGGTYYLPVKIGLNDTADSYWQLPNEPMVSISSGKMLKSTTLRRGKGFGTVTEERGLKDNKVLIRGLAINEDQNDYPDSQMRNIRRICEHSDVVYIKSYLTSIWNIKTVSVVNYDFPRFPANSIRVQPYVIELKSDLGYEDYRKILNR